MNNWGFLGRYWERLPYRKRCTCHALLAVTSTPYVVLEGRLVFHSMVTHAWYTGMLALMGLWATYYVVARAWIDLLTDIVDVTQGAYTLKGGAVDVDETYDSRTYQYPYDKITAPDVKRDWSNWQYLLACWMVVDYLIGYPAVFACTYASFNSPYIKAWQGAHIYHAHYRFMTVKFLFFLYDVSFVMAAVEFYSIWRRLVGGVTPISFRLLGYPMIYPGQNVLPERLNRIIIKLIGRVW